MAKSYPFTRSRLLLGLLVVSASCVKLPPADQSAVNAKVELTDAVTLVWDGDKHGGSAKEWANCNLKAACKSTTKAAPGAGVNGSVGLEWHAEGKDWKGFGWNWFGFYPEDSGTDVSTYKNLTFWIRLKVDDPKGAADLKDVKVGLGSSNKARLESESVSLIGYIDSLADQQWHEVVIPMSDLTKGKGKDFDLTRAWEFRLGE